PRLLSRAKRSCDVEVDSVLSEAQSFREDTRGLIFPRRAVERHPGHLVYGLRPSGHGSCGIPATSEGGMCFDSGFVSLRCHPNAAADRNGLPIMEYSRLAIGHLANRPQRMGR